MNIHYYQLLALGYGTALALWWGYTTIRGNSIQPTPTIRRPWLKSGIVLMCGVLTILIGQLYINSLLLPDFRLGTFRLGECLNQTIIFSPFLLYFPLTRESLETAWLPARIWKSQLAVGLVIACIALTVFVLMANTEPLGRVLANVFNIQNAHHAVQVFLEDLAISMLLARLAVAMGKKFMIITILAVSLLFAFGHLPANLESSKPLAEIVISLLMDSALVFFVCLTLTHFRSFVWFFPIHFVMDMMQFYSGVEP